MEQNSGSGETVDHSQSRDEKANGPLGKTAFRDFQASFAPSSRKSANGAAISDARVEP
jgi:hypothetical protein